MRRALRPYNLNRFFNNLITPYSAARLKGLESDLHLKGTEFATLLSILYVGYILCQIPSYVPDTYSLPHSHPNYHLQRQQHVS